MISSAVEHFVDIEGVTGSIPVSSTMNLHLRVLDLNRAGNGAN